MELKAYLHTGHNSFENHEISISRIFVPINFHAALSEGAELVLDMRQLERIGISGRFQYALQKTFFYGPIARGFPCGAPLFPSYPSPPPFYHTPPPPSPACYQRRSLNICHT